MNKYDIVASHQAMAERIGLPGGPIFRDLLAMPEPLLTAYSLKILGDRSLVESPIIQLIHVQWINWRIALNWLYKKRFDPKHRIPFNRKDAKIFEPIGEILSRLLLLTEYLYLYDSELKYPNHWVLFSQCAIELRFLLLIDYSEGKKGKIKQLRKITKAIKDGINPFPENYHLYQLIESSFRLNSCRSHFANMDRLVFAQSGLVAAIAHYATYLNTCGDLVTLEADNQHLIFNHGRGKGVQKLDPKKILL